MLFFGGNFLKLNIGNYIQLSPAVFMNDVLAAMLTAWGVPTTVFGDAKFGKGPAPTCSSEHATPCRGTVGEGPHSDCSGGARGEAPSGGERMKPLEEMAFSVPEARWEGRGSHTGSGDPIAPEGGTP